MTIRDPVYQPTGSWWRRLIDLILLAFDNRALRKREGLEDETAWWTRLERLSK